LDIADRRHVVVLTDGLPAPGDYHELAAEMAAAGLTVSTISVGASAEQLILKDIVRIARGRHYHCEDPATIPETLEKRFDRDKTDLRSLGIPVDYVAANSERSGGYVIDPNAAFLRRLEFTPAEALLLAIAGRVGAGAQVPAPVDPALTPDQCIV